MSLSEDQSNSAQTSDSFAKYSKHSNQSQQLNFKLSLNKNLVGKRDEFGKFKSPLSQIVKKSKGESKTEKQERKSGDHQNNNPSTAKKTYDNTSNNHQQDPTFPSSETLVETEESYKQKKLKQFQQQYKSDNKSTAQSNITPNIYNCPLNLPKTEDLTVPPSVMLAAKSQSQNQLVNAIIASWWMIKLRCVNLPVKPSLQTFTDILLTQSSKIKKKFCIDSIVEIERLIRRDGMYQINRSIYNSPRIQAGLENSQKFVFFPTPTTVWITQVLLDICFVHLTGIYGVGKTISLIFNVQIGNFEVKFALQSTKQHRQTFKKTLFSLIQDSQCDEIVKDMLKKEVQTKPVTKYFFISFDYNETNICHAMLDQCERQILTESEVMEYQEKTPTTIFRVIKQRYTQKGIKICIIVDQFNVLASLIRKALNLTQLIQEKMAHNQQAIQIQKELDGLNLKIMQLCNLYNELKNKIGRVVTCNSITIQRHLFEEYHYKITTKFKLYDQKELVIKELKYLQYEHTKSHLLEKTKFLWFQIEKLLEQGKYQQYKQIFLNKYKVRQLYSIELNSQTIKQYEWLIWEKPLDMNKVVLECKKVGYHIYKKQEFDQLLTQIKAKLPFQKQKTFVDSLMKLSHSTSKGQFVKAFNAHLELLRLTSKYIEQYQIQCINDPDRTPISFLGSYKVEMDKTRVNYFSKECMRVEYTGDELCIYQNPEKCKSALILLKEKVYWEVFTRATELDLDLEQPYFYAKHTDLYAQFMDSVFADVFSTKFRMTLENIKIIETNDESIVKKKVKSDVEIVKDSANSVQSPLIYAQLTENITFQVQKWSQFEQFNKQTVLDIGQNFKKAINLAQANEGTFISAQPIGRKTKLYSSKSRGIDGAIIMKQNNEINIQTFDITITCTQAQYTNKIKTIKTMYKQFRKNKETKIQLSHFIIGQEKIYKRNPTCFSNEDANIYFAAIKDLNIQFDENLKLSSKLDKIKRIAQKIQEQK